MSVLRNLTHSRLQIPALFRFNALFIASDGTDSRVVLIAAEWQRPANNDFPQAGSSAPPARWKLRMPVVVVAEPRVSRLTRHFTRTFFEMVF